MILTLFRCYWPTVHSYLKTQGLRNCVEDTFEHMMTLKLDDQHAKAIYAMLPEGAVIEVMPEFSYNKELLELKEGLIGFNSPAIKN